MKEKLSKLKEKEIWYLVLLLYIVSVIVRFSVANLDRVAVAEPDEIRYLKWAVSFFNEGKVSLNHITRMDSPLLYSLFISCAYAFSNKLMQITVISLLNCLMISSTIFPAYLLARKWIASKKLQFIAIVLIALLPDMSMSITFMAENLYIPLCVWLFCFFDQCISKQRKDFFGEVLLGFWCVLLYATKDVALYFVISILLLLLLTCFMNEERTDIKRWLSPAVFIVSFALFFYIYKYVVVKYILIDAGAISPGGEFGVPWKFKTLYDFLFYIYLNVFANMNTFVAFIYFPLAIPVLLFPILDRKDRKRASFGILTQLIAIGVITYLTSFGEHYGDLDVWQNMRYYSALIVWDIILLFRLFEKYILSGKLKEVSKTWIVGFTTFAVMLISFTFRLFKGGLVENTLLKCYKWLAVKETVINGEFGKFSVSYYELAVKAGIVLCIVFFTICFFGYKKKRYVMEVYAIFTGGIFILNTVAASDEFRTTYSAYFNEKRMEEAEILDHYFDGEDTDILVITKGFDKVLNTYYHQNSYWVFEDMVMDTYMKRGMIDFSKDSVRCQYPNNYYQDIQRIDYVILSKASKIQIINGEKMELDGLDYYELYKVENVILYLDDKEVIPQYAGKAKVLTPEMLLTQHDKDEERFISTHMGDALCYGPYQPITKGTYQIEFDYAVTEISERCPILILQIKTKEGSLLSDTIEENIGKYKAMFTVETNQSNMEIVLTPYFAGIEVKNITITKLED